MLSRGGERTDEHVEESTAPYLISEPEERHLPERYREGISDPAFYSDRNTPASREKRFCGPQERGMGRKAEEDRAYRESRGSPGTDPCKYPLYGEDPETGDQ